MCGAHLNEVDNRCISHYFSGENLHVSSSPTLPGRPTCAGTFQHHGQSPVCFRTGQRPQVASSLSLAQPHLPTASPCQQEKRLCLLKLIKISIWFSDEWINHLTLLL